MKELKIENSSRFAVVDDEDFERLSKYKWYTTLPSDNIIRTEEKFYVTKNYSLASEVMRRDSVMFDHADKNPFNNLKENLRETTYSQNNHNRGKRKNTSSKYVGVCWNKQKKIWQAYISINGNKIHLGFHKEEKNAAIAFNKEAEKLFGKFANLNSL